MAVDSTLIRGAYRANQPIKIAKAKFATDISSAITDPVKSYIDKKANEEKLALNEWDKYAESVLDNSDLVSTQYEDLYDDLIDKKTKYANADKKTKELMRRDLVVMASDYADYKALREDVAVNLDDYSPTFKTSKEGEAYLKILKGDGKKLISKDGRIGVEVDGEFKSISSIKQELDQNKIDTTSIEALASFRSVASSSKQPFNRETTKAKIKEDLVYKGNYNSLKNDEIIPGRTFRKDLATALTKKTYRDLGIEEKYFKGIKDVNIDDGIDDIEAENIIANLEQNENEMKKIMTEYYTNHIEENASDVIDPDTNNGYTKKEAVNLQRNLKNAGYLPSDFELKGRWNNQSQKALDDYRDEKDPPYLKTNEDKVEEEKKGVIYEINGKEYFFESQEALNEYLDYMKNPFTYDSETGKITKNNNQIGNFELDQQGNLIYR